MIKKVLLILTIFILIFSFCGCSLFGEKIVNIEDERIITLSDARKNELLDANLELIKSTQGFSSFFTLAELEAYATDYFSQAVIEEYFNKRIFVEKNGKIYSNINTELSYDVNKLTLKIVNGKIDIKNGAQSFDVEFNDGTNAKIIKFTAIFEENEWVLSSIYF